MSKIKFLFVSIVCILIVFIGYKLYDEHRKDVIRKNWDESARRVEELQRNIDFMKGIIGDE